MTTLSAPPAGDREPLVREKDMRIRIETGEISSGPPVTYAPIRIYKHIGQENFALAFGEGNPVLCR